jgi:hypothetical protein
MSEPLAKGIWHEWNQTSVTLCEQHYPHDVHAFSGIVMSKET